jgi:hypothetical protein
MTPLIRFAPGWRRGCFSETTPRPNPTADAIHALLADETVRAARHGAVMSTEIAVQQAAVNSLTQLISCLLKLLTAAVTQGLVKVQ